MTPRHGDRIAVLVSTRIDPVSGRPARSRADAAAVALAQAALGDFGQPWLCTAGDMPAGVARDYLALDVAELTRLALPAAASVVSALHGACRDHPLVLTGPRAESGLGSGLLPYALAQRLQRPLIDDVVDLRREPDGGWRVVQARPRGARQHWRIDPDTAAVLVTSPRLVQRDDLPRRYSWVAAQRGQIRDAAAPFQDAAAPGGVDWTLEPHRRQRRPLAPPAVEGGAARMARATGGSDAAAQGGVVVRDGSTEEKARRLLDHLRTLALL